MLHCVVFRAPSSCRWMLYVLPKHCSPIRQFNATTQTTTQVSTSVKSQCAHSCSFCHRTPITYGPAPHPGYTYGPPKVPPLSYYPGVQFFGNVSSGGYPDRRYKLPPQFLSADPYLYTTLLQPATQYNPDDWWERQATQNTAALHCTALYCTALCCNALYCTALHCTVL